MKNYLYYIFLAMMLNVLNLFGQSLWNNTGHIPQSCQVNWTKAGLQFDAPVVAVSRITVVNTDGNDDNAVLNAINQAKSTNGLVIIYFPKGEYSLTKPIDLRTTETDSCNSIVFQGEGKESILNFDLGNDKKCFYIHGTSLGPIHEDVNAYIDKGMNELNFDDLNGLESGDWIHFYEYDFPTLHSTASKDVVGQIVQIGTVNSSSIILKTPASKDFNYNLKIKKFIPIKRVGIENLKINRINTGYAKGGSNISFAYAINCWVKGVEFYKTSQNHINIGRSAHIEISGSYFDDANYHGRGGFGYGVNIGSSSTNCLIENNIFRKLRHSMILSTGANTNVFTYNYSREQEWTENGTAPDLCIHGNYPFSNLLEHNYVNFLEADKNYTPHGPYNAFVRNYSANPIKIKDVDSIAVVGCVVGNGNTKPIIYDNASYSIDIYGADYYNGDTFSHFQAWLGGSFYLDNLSLDDISYYYSNRPYFLPSNYTFPSIGPIYTYNSQTIPAKNRYSNTTKTYNTTATYVPQPLSVYISGPTSLGSNETGTFTANPSGGSGSYTDYRWWERNDEGEPGPNKSDNTILAPPPNTWIELTSLRGQQQISIGRGYDFSLKCEVTDSNGDKATDIHSVNVGGGFAKAASKEGPGIASVQIPDDFVLQSNYPNPFNPSTTIRFGLPQAATATVSIYSVTGEKVKTLVNGSYPAGYHTIQWDGRNETGVKTAAGVYVYELKAGGKRLVKKMILTK